MDISFIVPVYNSALSLRNCLESILLCPLSCEILLINDGSSDDSLLICNEYATKYAHFTLINQSNKGASSARNRGIENATGDYIWFVDADDTVQAQLFNCIKEKLAKFPDLICFNHSRVNLEGTQNVLEFKDGEIIKDGIDYIEKNHTFYLWNKLYKRALIGYHRFIEGTKNIEDLYFNLNVLPSAHIIYAISDIGYNYICVSDSSTSRSRNKRNLIKLSQDSLLFQRKILQDIENNSNARLRSALRKVLSVTLAGHLFSLIKYYNLRRFIKTISIYKKWGVYPIERSHNKRADLFISIINYEKLCFVVFIIFRIYLRLLSFLKKSY